MYIPIYSNFTLKSIALKFASSGSHASPKISSHHSAAIKSSSIPPPRSRLLALLFTFPSFSRHHPPSLYTSTSLSSTSSARSGLLSLSLYRSLSLLGALLLARRSSKIATRRARPSMKHDVRQYIGGAACIYVKVRASLTPFYASRTSTLHAFSLACTYTLVRTHTRGERRRRLGLFRSRVRN